MLKYVKFLPWSGERTGHQAHGLDQGCLRVDRTAGQHVALLLEAEAHSIALRRQYVALKIEHWRAVEAGDHARAEDLAAEARSLSADVKAARKP